MVAQRTAEAKDALLNILRESHDSVAPGKLRDQLVAKNFSRIDIQKAMHLALNNGLIKLDKSLEFEIVELQAA